MAENVIKAPKAMNRASALQVVHEIKDLQAVSPGTVYLDMSGVEKIDSSALGMLVHAWKTLGTTEKDIILQTPSEVVEKLLHDTNLHRLMKISHKAL